MESVLESELQKLRRMLCTNLVNSSKHPKDSPSSSSGIESPSTVPEKSFISRWRSGDRLFEGIFSPSGSSTPKTPSSPVHSAKGTPATIKKRHKSDFSDSEDYSLPCHYEYQRYHTEFTEICQIGAGSFGRVFKSRNKLDKFEYAIKKINIKNNSSHSKEKAIREALTLAQSSTLDDNSYIIKYYSAWIEKSTLYLVMELCDCSLPEYLDRTGQINEVNLIKIFRDVCKGLKKLHSHKIVHLDIKPENILFSFGHRFKIADLGLACITTNLCGEIPEGDARYLAPELMKIMPNDPDSIPDLTKADIFSLGCTMLEIMNGGALPNNGPLWHKIREGDIEIKGEYSQYLKDIIRKMLNRISELRPSADEILGMLLSKNKQKAKANENYIKFLESVLSQKENNEGAPVKKRKLSI